jgi:hypothetical protein
MLVDHAPNFTDVISALTGAQLKSYQRAVALVDADIGEGRGRLLWLFPPRSRAAARPLEFRCV